MPEPAELSPETETPEQTETPEPELKNLAELLSAGEKPEDGDKPTGDGGTEDGTPGEKPTKGKPTDLKSLAEKLETKPEDLYSIKVPMPNGESKTLGELKDLAAAQDKFTLRELQFEEERTRKEGELIRSQSELRELMAALPEGSVKPEVLEKVRAKHEATLKLERERTLEAIPEWKDEDRRTEDINGMVEHLKGYGFPENYLKTVFNHRTIKYIRDNYLREQRIRKALEQVKSAKPGKTASSKAAGKAPSKPSKAIPKGSRNRLEQLFEGLN